MSNRTLQQRHACAQLQRASRWLTVVSLLAACDPIPHVDVELGDEATTTESGGRFEIRVKLAQRPRGVVTVYALSSDESEGRVSDGVQFDARDWGQFQTLTVTGVDDDYEDGNISYEVAIYERSSVRHEPPRLIGTIELVNRDDDIAHFDALGDLAGGVRASYASDVSADGAIVVGWSADENGEQAFRWAAGAGLEALGGPASRANGVSPDGTRITGSVAEPSYQGGRAGVLWQDGAPYEILEGPHAPNGGPIQWLVVDGKAVLDDGRVYGTCIQYGAYGEPLGCRFQHPHDVKVYLLGHVFAADAAGNFAGTVHSERHAPFHTIATYNQAQLPYPGGVTCHVNWGCLAAAQDFSDTGAVIVGTSRVPLSESPTPTPSALFELAFAFDTEHGSVSLPDLDGGELRSGAYAISADGSIIAGFGSDDDGAHAVVWLERAPVLLASLVHEANGALPDGFELLDVRATSADGRTFVGNGRNAQGEPEAYRVVLPHAP